MKTKRLLVLFAFCIFALSFVACDKTSASTTNTDPRDITTAISSDTTIDTTIDTTLDTNQPSTVTTTTQTITNNKIIDQEVYDELLIYYSRIEKIINHDLDANELSYRRDYIVDRVYEYSREELLENFLNMEFEYNYSVYFDMLDEVSYFVQRIINSIENESGECIDQKYYPDPHDLKEFYQFSITEDDFLVIQAHKYNSKYFIKLGFADDLLTYKYIQYYYDLNSELTNLEDSLQYRYYELLENVECIEINNFTYQKLVSYESIENEEAYTILYDKSVLVDGVNVASYSLHGVDVENLVIYNLNVSDDLDIVGESYSVFTDLGSLYSLSDYDVADDEVSITTNFIEATGWDYLVSTNYTNDEGITKEAGIYSVDGISLYTGSIPCANTKEYVITQLTRSITKSELTDSELNLSNYGMFLDNEKATLSYLNSIKIENVLDIQQDFVINGINLFEENKFDTLYNYLDDDIKQDINGESNNTVVTTGDLDDLLASISSFKTINEDSNEVVFITTKENIFDDQEYSYQTTDNYLTEIDYDDMYYRVYNHGNNIDTESSIFTAYHDNLVDFNSDEFTMKYSIYAQDNLASSFSEYVTSMIPKEIDVLSSLISVEKIDDYNYNLVIDKSFMGKELNMNDIFFQQGYVGFNDAICTGTLNFSDDFSEYTLIISLTGLYLIENPQIKYSTKMTVKTSYQTFDLTEPFSMDLYVYLPKIKGDIILDSIADKSYKVCVSEKQSNWLKFYLEEGYYNTHLGNSYTVYDALGNLIEVYDYLIIDEAGTYYIDLNTNETYKDTIEIIKVPDREMVTLSLENSLGNVEVCLETGEIDYYILSSIYTYDTVIRVDFPQLETFTSLTLHTDQFSNGGTWGKTFYGDAMSMYYYLPANETLKLKLTGDFLGTIQLNYEVIQVPQSPSDISNQTLDTSYLIQDIILTPNAETSRINFTVTESDYYRIVYECYQFDYTNITVDLYRIDGTLMSADSEQKIIALEPGEYYYMFHYREGFDLKTIVILAELRKGV